MRTFLRFFILFLLAGCSSQRPPVTHIPSTTIITTHTEAITNNSYPAFLSNYARLFVHTLAQETPLCSIPENYIPSDYLMLHFPVGILRDSVFCITGFLEVEKGFRLSKLKELGIFLTEGEQLFTTAYIPLHSLCRFLRLKGIIRFELTRRAELQLNVARPAVNAQILLEPPANQSGLTGEGVIVGVVDYGFDYTHPDFYDSTGIHYRIVRVWEQAQSGTPPPGFPYGRELIGQANIQAAATDTKSETHGTHVAGIAAGGGFGTGYYGLAPAAELVLVSTTRTDAGIADGLKYIADYANLRQKPCVINFSLGSSIGPHDGTSSFDRLCDQRVRAGLLFTGSVGNDGNKDIYLSHPFSGNISDTLVMSAIRPTPGADEMIADLWGDPAIHFQASVVLVDTISLQEIGKTPFVNTADSAVSTFNINMDSTIAVVQVAAEKGRYNQKPNLLVQITLTSKLPTTVIPLLKITCSGSGGVYGWLTGGEFTNMNQPYPYLTGNNSHTVGEIGGTGKSILSAGAFCTKNQWESVDNKMYEYGPLAVLGEIAYFSSRGPTADGRIKPDITCPGYGVVSAFSHYFNGVYPPGFYRVTEKNFNNTPYCWGILQGTSEAAPIVAGVLALWLQQNPDLTLQQARNAIRQTAIPGGNAALPNNTWGWGILDAAKGLSIIK
ncbi:MAG: S8 family serine peptidase [Bacteroidales bacterium]